MKNFKNEKKWVSAEEAMSLLQPGHRVVVHGASATPIRLIEAMVQQHQRLKDIEIFHLHTSGAGDYAQLQFADSFKVSSFFLGANMRRFFKPPQVDYLPCTLAEIPSLMRSKRVPVDVVLIHVSPPDEHGDCSLGTSVDIMPAAIENAKIVIAQVNPHMPRVHGDGFISFQRIDRAVWVEDELPEAIPVTPTDEEKKIGSFVADLVEDGSTLQMGIGAIPDAVLGQLTDRKHLGIHTEMWSDGALKLIKCGAVDNSLKRLVPGKTVSAFITGSKEVYRFIHDNQATVQLDVSFINNPLHIAKNPKVVAINSALEVDWTGQVCADSIGPRIISGTGGQLDFIYGASRSAGGKPIIALTSRTKSGQARIVPHLKQGAGVVTPRSLVHYIVTEFGAVDLYGKTLAARAQALIDIAHPEDRENLHKAWWDYCRSL